MRYLIALLLVLALPAEAKQKRDLAVKREFILRAPNGACPATGERRLPCPGWEAHHVVPLYCGGMDVAGNLVWLTTDQHRALHSRTTCRVKR